MSHFIIWNHTIVWCGGNYGDQDVVVEEEVQLRERVLPLCTQEWKHYTELAEQLDEVPWDVNRVCRYLARCLGVLIEGEDKLRDYFKLSTTGPNSVRYYAEGTTSRQSGTCTKVCE